MQDIRRQTERLATLTGDLISLSRLEEQAPLQMLTFPFSDMVEETAHSFLARAKQQNKSLTLSVEPMLSLCGDEKALTQLVTILLDNALKYSDDGGHIDLSLSHSGKSVRLTVENSSETVNTAQLPQLFDRFCRGDRSRSSQNGGYGLGLSIAKAIVQAHKGKIAASSRDGHSVLITVTLRAEHRERVCRLPFCTYYPRGDRMKGTELPLGFGMALAQNETAMKKFESLTETEKQSVLEQAHHVNSKREMQRLVAGIAAYPEA